jgi:hypothetical protein
LGRGSGQSKLASAINLSCFRFVVAIDLVLVVLSFLPGFEGSAGRIGVADKLFGRFGLGGFRIDFVWLATSTALLVLLLILHARTTSLHFLDRRLDRVLAVMVVVGFIVYMIRIFAAGLVDFG